MKSGRPARPVYVFFSLIKFHFFKVMASLNIYALIIIIIIIYQVWEVKTYSCHSSAINHQRSIINDHQQQIINNRSSTINGQQLITDNQSSMLHRPRVTTCLIETSELSISLPVIIQCILSYRSLVTKLNNGTQYSCYTIFFQLIWLSQLPMHRSLENYSQIKFLTKM